MHGFTLVELLVVLAILVIVAALAIPFVYSWQTSSDLYTDADTLTQILRRARHQAVTGQNQKAWGVYFDSANHQFILFAGGSFSSRETEFDQAFDYPESFNLTTDFGEEIYFSAYTGQASASGMVTLAAGDQSEQILISRYGKIEKN